MEKTLKRTGAVNEVILTLKNTLSCGMSDNDRKQKGTKPLRSNNLFYIRSSTSLQNRQCSQSLQSWYNCFGVIELAAVKCDENMSCNQYVILSRYTAARVAMLT